MDIKRLFFALILSFTFIITWNIFFPPDKIEAADSAAVTLNQKAPEAEKLALPVFSSNYFEGESMHKIKTPLMELELTNGATSISSISLVEKNNGYYQYAGMWEGGGNVYLEDEPVRLIHNSACNPCLFIDNKPVKFVAYETEVDLKAGVHKLVSSSNLGIVKVTTVYDNTYSINHEFYNLPESNNVYLHWDSGLEPTEKLIKDDISYYSVFAQNRESYKEEYLSSVDENEEVVYDDNVGWGGIKNKYFMKAITNQNYDKLKAEKVVFQTFKAQKINKDDVINSNIQFYYKTEDLDFDANGQKGLAVSSYIGPIDTQLLENGNGHLVQLFGFGWFFIGYLAKGIMWMLTSMYEIIPNYGVICILFAFIIRFFTGPLTKKSFLSNQKMQAVQPKMKKIQEKYKDSPTQLNQEIMSLYKTEGVNPLGGCLPILVQMPLLIALFQVFRKTIEFRGAEFLPFWITDLSQPDVVLYVPFLNEIWGLNYFFGHGIALLPIIMGVVMFMNMKMTATNNLNPSAASTMYLMNGFFILLFNTFPSGLNLYYTIYNVLNFMQQRKLQKISS